MNEQEILNNRWVGEFPKIHIEQLEHQNQFTIQVGNRLYFQSYNSIVACWNDTDKQLTLFRNWDYSNTTLRHLYIFIDYYTNLSLKENGKKKAQIEELLKKGVILYNNNY